MIRRGGWSPAVPRGLTCRPPAARARSHPDPPARHTEAQLGRPAAGLMGHLSVRPDGTPPGRPDRAPDGEADGTLGGRPDGKSRGSARATPPSSPGSQSQRVRVMAASPRPSAVTSAQHARSRPRPSPSPVHRWVTTRSRSCAPGQSPATSSTPRPRRSVASRRRLACTGTRPPPEPPARTLARPPAGPPARTLARPPAGPPARLLAELLASPGGRSKTSSHPSSSDAVTCGQAGPGSGTSRIRPVSRPRPAAASTPASGSPAIPHQAPSADAAAASARHSRPNSATATTVPRASPRGSNSRNAGSTGNADSTGSAGSTGNAGSAGSTGSAPGPEAPSPWALSPWAPSPGTLSPTSPSPGTPAPGVSGAADSSVRLVAIHLVSAGALPTSPIIEHRFYHVNPQVRRHADAIPEPAGNGPGQKAGAHEAGGANGAGPSGRRNDARSTPPRGSRVVRNGRSFAGFGRYGNQNRRTIRDRVTGGSGVTDGIAAAGAGATVAPLPGLGAPWCTTARQRPARTAEWPIVRQFRPP